MAQPTFRRFLSVFIFTSLVFVFITTAAHADNVLVSAGSTWMYKDDGSNQGTAWRSPSFNDSTWASGPAQLGYGDGDESTVVNSGPGPKYITTYFRLAFSVSDPSAYSGLTVRLLRDDGAVVYLNGTEVVRSNMPSGTIDYDTPASTSTSGEDDFHPSSVSASHLVTGTNVVAVEVHQSSGWSTDLGFDLEIIGTTTSGGSISVTRGPYLQTGTPTSMIVRWRTNSASDSRVRYGTSLSNLSSTANDLTSTTEHQVQLTNLLPATKYYYSIGTTAQTLAGGDSSHYFITAPTVQTDQPTRVWALGDSGTANSSANAVRDAYQSFAGSAYTHIWLMLGDNAYESGTDSEYQSALFDIYPEMLRKTPLWPSIGNHESISSTASTQTGPYFNIFTLPTNGEAGGIASGTEAYYSFDYANIHFICLESHRLDHSPSSEMVNWLRSDLSATSSDWVIAFWHHAPHSRGAHNSDTDRGMTEMRENVLPVLEEYGVDLVLAAHSHSYERTFLIDGHYDVASTFSSSMIVDGGSGKEDSSSGPYTKPSTGPAPHEGTVYFVAGSSGQMSGSGTMDHPAMHSSLKLHGSVILDINGNRLDAKFLDKFGTVQDYFTILKGSGGSDPMPPQDPSNLTATAVSSSQINLSWSDNSNNEDGFHIQRSTDGSNFSQIATTGANATTYNNTQLSPSTHYFYRVRAFNSAGNSGFSNVADATTQASSGGTTLTAPSNLSATQTHKRKVQLSWTDNSQDETGFEIQRSTDGENFQNIKTVSANTTGFSNNGTASNATYYYRVRAYRTVNGNTDFSAYSNIASVTTN